MIGIPRTSQMTRYREIVSVLTRHGFGWLITELDLRNMLPLGDRLFTSQTVDSQESIQALHLRLAFEELGPTFIKLGQVLSTRSDLLSPAYTAELAKLQDAAPTVPYTHISTVLETDLGEPPDEVFAEIDHTPLAAASIGQVHAARLQNGSEVVVKVQRPGIVEAIDGDLDVLLDLARAIDQHTDFGRQYNVLGLLEEFAFNLRCELDYAREAQNVERFSRAFEGDPDIYIPQIYWAHTTSRVLVMERLDGYKVTELEELECAGISRQQIAANIVRLMLEEIFIHGMFHADPHPGNLFVLPDGKIGMVDFGMVGYVDERLQESLSRLFLALSKGDSVRLMDEMYYMGMLDVQVNRQILRQDLDHMIICYVNQSVQDLAAAGIFSELTKLARRHHVQLPSNLVLMAKMMAINEGISLRMDPDFQFVPFIRPYLKEYWMQRHSPKHIGVKVADGIVEMAELSLTMPQRLTRLAAQMERGELGAQVEVRGADHALDRAQRMVNQLGLSIIVGSLIIGLSQFMHMVAPEGFLKEWAGRFYGMLFFVAISLGFGLLVSILRSGKRLSR